MIICAEINYRHYVRAARVPREFGEQFEPRAWQQFDGVQYTRA